MKAGPNIAMVAALIGDPARANILTALMSGKALTATELASEAGITPQTASSHLARLEDGGLVVTRRQGRHKYVSLASDQVAAVLEGLMGLTAGAGHLRTRTGPKEMALREARVCYNHLAGDRGVQMYDALFASAYLRLEHEEPVLTEAGAAWATEFGIDLGRLRKSRAPLCKSCLDWSERRSHLAGSLGRALFSQMSERGWMHRDANSRVVRFTPNGRQCFDQMFRISSETALD